MICRIPVTRLAICLLIIGATLKPEPIFADVVTPLPDECTQSEEIGELEVTTELIPPENATCVGEPAKRLRVTAVTADWATNNLPLLMVMKRDRTGYRLYLLSMLSDRRYRQVCWSEQTLASADTKSPSLAWRFVVREFGQWASTCPTVLTLGAREAERSLTARQHDFERSFIRLTQVRRSRFGSSEDGIAIGSFLPTRISQSLLDAVADACGGPRERLKLLGDGTIAWSFDGKQPYGADGSRPFDSCVNDQIRFFPGYQNRS